MNSVVGLDRELQRTFRTLWVRAFLLQAIRGVIKVQMRHYGWQRPGLNKNMDKSVVLNFFVFEKDIADNG